MKLPGVILAAGRSTRMGRDKALLPHPQGGTFLARLCSVFSARLAPVIVVLGHHAQDIRISLKDSEVKQLINFDFDLGMLSSLQAGLTDLPADAPGCIFTLVDHPSLRPETLQTVIEAFDGDRIVIPRYRGRRGHPVALPPAVILELLALEATASPKDVIRRYRNQTIFLDLDDPAIVEDIDRPEDLSKLQPSSEPSPSTPSQ